MTVTQELIERLRGNLDNPVSVYRAAADRLAEQEAEIERLRAALTKYTTNCLRCGGEGSYITIQPDGELNTPCPDCSEARAALEQKP